MMALPLTEAVRLVIVVAAAGSDAFGFREVTSIGWVEYGRRTDVNLCRCRYCWRHHRDRVRLGRS